MREYIFDITTREDDTARLARRLTLLAAVQRAGVRLNMLTAELAVTTGAGLDHALQQAEDVMRHAVRGEAGLFAMPVLVAEWDA
jgi:hypothetical protein